MSFTLVSRPGSIHQVAALGHTGAHPRYSRLLRPEAKPEIGEIMRLRTKIIAPVHPPIGGARPGRQQGFAVNLS